MVYRNIKFKTVLKEDYNDIFTLESLSIMSALAHFNTDIKEVMATRLKRRKDRQKNTERIKFLDADTYIPRTKIKVQDASDGNFEGGIIPSDLQKQWIQGTGPAAKANASVESSIQNVAYALLSGADGWMFDGEGALGQIKNMSLDNQRNVQLAISKDPIFMKVAEQVAEEMNRWAMSFFGHLIVNDWKKQLGFTTLIFRVRGFHLDDRHITGTDGIAMSASIVDMTLYVVNNYKKLQIAGSSIVLYVPKIQTAEEASPEIWIWFYPSSIFLSNR
jgi:malate synthase